MNKLPVVLAIVLVSYVLLAQSWAADSKTDGEKEYRDPTTGIEFVLVKGGCYEMGDTFGDGGSGDNPVHEVCVDNFYIGKYDVTVRDFRMFVNDTGYSTEAEKSGGCWYFTGSAWKNDGSSKNWRNPGFTQDDRNPVACVSWIDAKAFADWMQRKIGMAYRLPREAEWEYAAREGGKKVRFGTGTDTISSDIANFNASAEHKKPYSETGQYRGATTPVWSFKPNSLGLYDMTGNVWQWCEDWYSDKYYSESPRDNPTGPGSGQYRVLRGGSWTYGAANIRAALRGRNYPARAYSFDGFRLAFSPAR